MTTTPTTTDTPSAASTSSTVSTDPGTAIPAVAVRLFAGAAAAYGADTATVHGSTVAEAISDLTEGASADARTAIERSSLLVNAISCTDHSRALEDGDRIDVLPPFAGG